MLDLRPSAVAGVVRSRLRPLSTTALSLLIVLAGVYYVLAPTSVDVRFDVNETATVPHADVEATPRYDLVAATRATEVVYGKVDTRSVTATGISLRLSGIKPPVRGQVATIEIARPNVAFRAQVHLIPGLYQFTLTMRVDGRTRVAQIVRTLRDRRNYRTVVTVRAGGVVTFVPVTSY